MIWNPFNFNRPPKVKIEPAKPEIKISEQKQEKVQRVYEKVEGLDFDKLKTELVFPEDKKRLLSVNEAAKVIFQSFRFSQGNVTLQLELLILANKYYGDQNLNPNEVMDEFLKLIKPTQSDLAYIDIGRTDRGYNEVHLITKRGKTDFVLSDNKMHTQPSTSNFAELTKDKNSLAFADCLIGKKYDFTRLDRDGYYPVYHKEKDLNIGKQISLHFFYDFRFFFPKKVNKIEEAGRPNRDSRKIGTNNMSDAYFSYFVWFILNKNKTGNSFFDDLFKMLYEDVGTWFNSLPDHRSAYYLDEVDNLSKDDVVDLILKYNETHPETKVTKEELAEVGIKLDI